METIEKKENKKILRKLKSKYRLVILNDQSFEEKFSSRLSPLNVITGIGLAFLLFAIIFVSTIVFTPLKEFIPGYSDNAIREMAIDGSLKVDSIQEALRVQDRYVRNLIAILHGENPTDSILNEGVDGLKYSNLNFEKSKQDSVLRQRVEEEDRFNFSLNDKNVKLDLEMAELFFFAPVAGEVSQSYNASEKHFGVDLVAEEGTAVKAALPGVVIFSGWTEEGGNMIQIQHEGEILTVYKHNEKLLRQVGDRVKSGESIAIIGGTGEYSTGVHLHFEVWRSGKPINPELIIDFN